MTGTDVYGKNVILKKAAGRAPGRYFYGGSLSDVPLGTRARVHRTYPVTDRVDLILNDGRMLAVKYDEIKFLEDGPTSSRWSASRLEKVLITDEIQTEKPDKKQNHKFRPKFSVREEFAVWVRSEFPDLERYAMRREQYPEFNKRRREIIRAAISACNHGIRTTNSCVRNRFHREKGYMICCLFGLGKKRDFLENLNSLVDFIEHVSANLPYKYGMTHYGTGRIYL